MTEDDNAVRYRVRRVYVGDDRIIVELRDGRGEIVAPLESVPELQEASQEERTTWRLRDGGSTIEWPKLNLRVPLQRLPPPELYW